MEIKVRALGESEEKSPQEKEQEIINKHEAKEKSDRGGKATSSRRKAKRRNSCYC